MQDKQYKGAPFGIQTARFDVNGVHPRRKVPGTLTQVTYDKNSMLDVTRRLGPGTYKIIDGLGDRNGNMKVSGIDWARQLEIERQAAKPHIFYQEQWQQDKILKRKLGPGSYEIKDFIQLTSGKPRSVRGICDNLAPRFEKDQEGFTPGPGSYGVDGIPQKAIDNATKSFPTRGMLELGGRDRNVTTVGSHLGPGTYNFKSSTDELLNKVTSAKGPYKLYSGDRNKPISEGYQAAPKHSDLGPGQYKISSFVDDMNDPHSHFQGRFGKLAQYPEVPTDRIFLFSKTHHPKMKDSLGPGSYNIQEIPRSRTSNSPGGFLSTARRDDKMAQKFFTRNFNPVGPGRYDIQKFEEAQDVNGHTSVFRSKTGMPSLQVSKVLQERIQSRDINAEDGSAPFQQKRVTRSITVL